MPIKSLYKTKSSLYRKAFEKKGLGNFRSYQRGGTLPPIYTPDPNDSRIRRYSDSLNLYNFTQKGLNAVRNGRSAYNEWDDIEPNRNRVLSNDAYINTRANNYIRRHPNENLANVREDIRRELYFNNIRPTNVIQYGVRTSPNSFEENYTVPIYKKPVQPVQYADPKIVEKQKKLKEVGLYAGRLDGVWGKKSKEAWKKYEENLSAEKTPTTPTTPTTLTTTTTSTTPTPTSNPTPTRTPTPTTTATTTVPATPPVVKKPVIYTAPTKVQPKTTQTNSDTPWRFMLGNDSYQTFDEETAKTFAKDLGITNLQRGDNKNIDSATGKYRDYSSLISSPTTNTGTTGQITKYPKLKRMAFGGTVKSAPRLAKIYKASKLRK